MEPFSTKGSIHESWSSFKKHWALLWGSMIIMLVINSVISILGEKQSGLIAFLIGGTAFVASVFMRLGFMRLTLNVVTGNQAHIDQLFGESQKLLRFIGASIIYSVIVGVGFILLIIPGIVWSIKYGYYGYLILDKDLGVVESLKKSGEITKGAKWKLLGIGLIMGLLVMVSIIPLGLGLIATIPMAALLTPLLYVRLMNRNEPGQPTSETPPELTSTQTEVPKPPHLPETESAPETQSV